MSKMKYQTARAFFLGEVAGTKLNSLHVLRAGQLLNKSINDIKLFGMSPINWYAIGIRIMGRTAVEATRDPHAEFIARSIAATLSASGHEIREVIDPFIGSGNLAYHVALSTGAKRIVGLDIDEDILKLTRDNFRILCRRGKLSGVDVELFCQNWSSWPKHNKASAIVIIHPPWRESFTELGLDLYRTEPPVPTILATLYGRKAFVCGSDFSETYSV